jgi:hypothetical protein
MKIISRNQISSCKINNNLSNQNSTYNDGITLKLFDSEEDKKINNNNYIINNKKYCLSNSYRKNSTNTFRNNYISIKDNIIKENHDNNKNLYCNKIYTTMSSKNNKFTSSIFNTNNSVNNITDDESHIKPLSSNNLNHTNINIESKESKVNYIKDYKNIKKSKKLVLNISHSNEKIEKKFDSKILLSNDRKNMFNLPKKKIKAEIFLRSLSPKEILINDKASNILSNLNEIKMEIKTEKKNNNTTNIKHMINTIKQQKNKDTEYIKNEVKKNKFYEYFMKNKKEIGKTNEIFKILRNSFNTERIKRNSNELSFIKTLNHICEQEKHFDSVVKHVYRQNYWLRLSKNKKIAENMKNRINKINAHYVQLNTLVTKINKLQNKHNRELNNNNKK